MCLDDKKEKSLYTDKSNVNMRRRKEKMNSKVDGPEWGHAVPEGEMLK